MPRAPERATRLEAKWAAMSEPKSDERSYVVEMSPDMTDVRP